LKTNLKTYSTKLLKRRWLSRKTFEIILSRPRSFAYKPGQRIGLMVNDQERDYSLVSSTQDSELALCIRRVAAGILSPLLSTIDIDTPLSFTGPHGYFTFKPSPLQAVFVATGTGIAPFCSMARSGVAGFILLHGVSRPDDLYYALIFKNAAKAYVPCLSQKTIGSADAFKGRVTEYLEHHLPPTPYEFYLCGGREMIRDVTLLIDERFPGSLVYTELFY
jgi:benzoate/toluate 1,2-dioxygenase reductase subunit